MGVASRPEIHDERRLAELGYEQSLHHGWTSFSNFAISFTIISLFAVLDEDAPVRGV
ncbi:hypothetical protein [Capillimicrobium parvum]|uniref:Uncharacterized protein n=1 Tax=Capillimicrobium parvum TaxID=2884022 RepID=A0A9E6XWH1_9ACTN|nr:hypothetical protein [Capillimicrobium parvum]UGS35378.1 hypothetical protein DSM104329_01766 [Capillimicrobium parvum]